MGPRHQVLSEQLRTLDHIRDLAALAKARLIPRPTSGILVQNMPLNDLKTGRK